MLTRRTLSLSGAAALLMARGAWAEASAPSAQDTLDHERALAAQENKGVLLVFFASWCGWCQVMDRFLAGAEAQRVIASRFRILHMRAYESDAPMQARQLTGAETLYQSYANGAQGLPFAVFMKADGTVLTTSRASNGDNIGFPGARAEYAWFVHMLTGAVPDAPQSDRDALVAACERLNPVRS